MSRNKEVICKSKEGDVVAFLVAKAGRVHSVAVYQSLYCEDGTLRCLLRDAQRKDIKSGDLIVAKCWSIESEYRYSTWEIVSEGEGL